MPAITNIAHIELSVRDIDRSEAWYTEVFGLRRVSAGEDGGRGWTDRALLHPETRMIIALTCHAANAGEPFDPRRTGLDHVAFLVSDRDVLEEWERRFAEMGTDYTPIEERPFGWALTARDPDGIALEFIARVPRA